MDRFWEVDFFRGVAIIMMVLFHLLFDLNYFGKYLINVHSGFWLYFSRATAILFLLLVGISLTLSYSRSGGNFWKYLKRGLMIFSCGLIITFITWLFVRDAFVMFGVLHLIGISIIISYFLIRFKYLNLVLGFILIGIGLYLKTFIFKFSVLFWLIPNYFNTIDYFPLLPWFGVVLLGLFIGNVLYSNYQRRFSITDLSKFSFVKLLCFLGRNSLIIYLIHQPALLGIISLF